MTNQTTEPRIDLLSELPGLLQKNLSGKELTAELQRLIKAAGGPSQAPDGDTFMRHLMSSYHKAMLECEMEQHLGYERNGESPTGNYRNGTSKKRVKSNVGELTIEVPRDRQGTFDPVVVKKHQSTLPTFQEAIISLYTRGLTTREIEAHIKEIYGTEVSPTFVSRVTERLTEERKTWQARPLDPVYPVLYLDGIRFPVQADGRVIKKVVYVAVGIDVRGKPDVLGLWAAENEGAQFWLHVCTELKNRGVKDVLIACVDGLKGLPEALEATFQKVDIQLCVVHMIRAATRFISYKDRRPFCADLKTIYSSPTLEAAELQLDELEKKWGKKYPGSIRVWRDNWNRISVFFKYSPEIRKFIYTTNNIENLNACLRKNTRSRKIFPSDDALLKILYLNILNFTKKWSHRQGWDTILQQLVILEGDRLAAALEDTHFA
jgi:transposase-like protein